jgi:signal peptidase I
MENSQQSKYKKILLWILDLVVNVAVCFGILMLIEKFLIAPFDIYGPSMCNNLNFINNECVKEYGEKIILDKASLYVKDPQRGDIIVFTPKFSDEKFFIKRIIGLPGETVEILNGEIYITNNENQTGIQLEESYLNQENIHNTETFATGYKIYQVPENEYFVLGDNRGASTDSRSCFRSPYSGGCENKIEDAFVKKEDIEGKAWVVFWPIKNWETIDRPEYKELQKSSLEEK